MKTKETSKKNSRSTRSQRLAALGVGVFFAFILLEIMTRLLLWVNPDFISFEEQNREFLIENEYWKIWHFPNNEVNHERACFDVDYTTNSLGMKDQEPDTSKYTVALIGDSYIEGYGEPNESSMFHYLDSLTGNDVDVLNFGTSGGFGTVHEYAIYQNFVRHFKPDVVVLFFLSYNDLYDNVNAIAEGLIDDNHEFTFRRAESFEEVKTAITNVGQPEEVAASKGWLVAPKLIGKGIKSLEVAAQYAFNIRGEFKSALGHVLSPESTETLNEGYEIFEKSLSAIKAAVEANGSKLALVQIPTPYQVDDNWLSMNGRKLGVDLQADYPNQKVNEIATSMNIQTLDLLPAALDHIQENELKYPYLYHSCDAHMSAEGNLWFASQVHNYLKQQNLLPNGLY